MTLNELSILKNGVLDATEAYVDARLENLPFAKTEIGVVSGVYIEKTISGIKTLIPVTVNTPISNDKLLHTVRVGSSNRYKEYKNVLSVGNIEYEIGAVVFIIVPNGQYSNSFIMGKLDTSPVNVNGGELHIGKMPSIIDGKEYYFNVDKQGNVEMLKGSLKYNYNDTLQDYSFIVDKNGIKSGINGTSPSDKDWFFKLDNQGNVKIEHGSIKLGKINTTKYRFEVDDNGNITRRDANGKEIFKVDDTGVEISGYLEDGAFNSSTRSNRTKIDGSHIETGYIRSSNLSGQTTLSDYNAKFTTKGTIIDLTDGFISSRKFYIDKDGNAKFAGELSAPTGSIAGFTIDSNELTYKESGSDGVTKIKGDQFYISSFAQHSSTKGHKTTIGLDTSVNNERLYITNDGDAEIVVGNQAGWDAHGNYVNPKNGYYTALRPTAIHQRNSYGTCIIPEDVIKFLSNLADNNLNDLEIKMSPNGNDVLFRSKSTGKQNDIILF